MLTSSLRLNKNSWFKSLMLMTLKNCLIFLSTTLLDNLSSIFQKLCLERIKNSKDSCLMLPERTWMVQPWLLLLRRRKRTMDKMRLFSVLMSTALDPPKAIYSQSLINRKARANINQFIKLSVSQGRIKFTLLIQSKLTLTHCVMTMIIKRSWSEFLLLIGQVTTKSLSQAQQLWENSKPLMVKKWLLEVLTK